jgi:hypothetical protein
LLNPCTSFKDALALTALNIHYDWLHNVGDTSCSVHNSLIFLILDGTTLALVDFVTFQVLWINNIFGIITIIGCYTACL